MLRGQIKKEEFSFNKMRNFHSSIKKDIINRYCKNIDLLISLGSGKAGDLHKWVGAGIKKVIGFDINEEYIKEGRESEFWQLMKKNGVDIYLCGEVHAITCTERDGVMQVAHGGLIGYNTRINYMVTKFTKEKIEMELKEIELLPHGEFLWQTKNNRPLEYVTISDSSKARGFYTVGKLTIDKTHNKEFKNRKGYFLKKYESSNETANPIFKKNLKPTVPTELPKIIVE